MRVDAAEPVLTFTKDLIVCVAERAENKEAVGPGRGRMPIFAPHRIGRDGLPGDGPAFGVDESTEKPDASLQYDPAQLGRDPDIRVLPRLRGTVEVLVWRIGKSRLRRLVSRQVE